MLEMSTTAEFGALQHLLSAWKLPQLLQHFQDEGVNVEELELMQSHHACELLRPFKMSLRIRFEHHFEKWRRNMNKPLLHNQMRHCCCNTSKTSYEHRKTACYKDEEAVPLKRYKTRATNTETIEDLDSPILASSPSTSLIDLPHELPRLTPQPQRPASKRLKRMVSLTPPLPPEESITEQTQTIKFHDVVQNGPVTLMQILHSACVKGGGSLLDYYSKHQELTHSHRCLLIQLIVNFFVENDYHLSLSTSHNLELQILKQFPTEKLEYYRNEKRGKIYVKFCNLKRYKRMPSKRNYAQSMLESFARLANDMEVVDANTEDDEYSIGFDWPEQPVEVQVKAENFGEDE